MAVLLGSARRGAKLAGRAAGAIDDYAAPVLALKSVEVPGVIRSVALASQRQYGAAAGNLIGGSAGEAAARVTGRGYKTARRAGRSARRAGLLRSKRLKRQGVGFIRGATTGAVKNRRLIASAATGGALSLGSVANDVTKRTIGNTKVGKILTTDISKPVYRVLKVRRRLRTATGGLFSSC